MFAHWTVKLNPLIHTIAYSAPQCLSETNAAWMSTLLLCNTFNAWTPCENRSCWTFCIAFPIMWNWKACYSLYTDRFWIGFIYLYHKYPRSHGVSHASCWEWWEWKKLKSSSLALITSEKVKSQNIQLKMLKVIQSTKPCLSICAFPSKSSLLLLKDISKVQV